VSLSTGIFSFSTTLRNRQGLTGNQPLPSMYTSARQCCALGNVAGFAEQFRYVRVRKLDAPKKSRAGSPAGANPTYSELMSAYLPIPSSQAAPAPSRLFPGRERGLTSSRA
jgi:hypothetical protein